MLPFLHNHRSTRVIADALPENFFLLPSVIFCFTLNQRSTLWFYLPLYWRLLHHLHLLPTCRWHHLSIISVYSACTHSQKPNFLTSIEHVATLSSPIAILGDFNLARSLRDKSNQTNRTITSTRPKLIFSTVWSITLASSRSPLRHTIYVIQPVGHPILARLNRVLVSPEWSFALPDSTLTSFARTKSNHVPLHLAAFSKAPISSWKIRGYVTLLFFLLSPAIGQTLDICAYPPWAAIFLTARSWASNDGEVGPPRPLVNGE
jgi:hypothetical protein